MFIAYVNQTDNGCDYTIDCGKTLWKLDAATVDEAMAELRRLVIGEWVPEYNAYEEGYRGESKLKEITLFEVVNSMEIPLGNWYAEAHSRELNAGVAAQEAAEKTEYERLKAKFD